MDINSSFGYKNLNTEKKAPIEPTFLEEDTPNFLDTLSKVDQGKKPALLNSLKEGESMKFRNTSTNAYFTNMEGMDNLV